MNKKSNTWVRLAVAILFGTILMVFCTGCDEITKKQYDSAENKPKMMTVVDRNFDYTIYRHDETGVHYFSADGGYGTSVCIMLNADGTPYIGEVGDGNAPTVR